jgi:isoquinoline 1-oxidoreductase alpha subunit
MKMTVNGRKVDLQATPDTPLLWVLRDQLQLTGTKYGCGTGQCGSCMVHVNGMASLSCSLPVGALEGAQITTIEGVGASFAGRAVQEAWTRTDGNLCGYCQPGQVMSATALLARTPHPDAQQVQAAMAGNLCRCGCYPAIGEAVALAARILRAGAAK